MAQLRLSAIASAGRIDRLLPRPLRSRRRFAGTIRRSALYCFTPDWVRYLDNSRKFGFKFELRLVEGRCAGLEAHTTAGLESGATGAPVALACATPAERLPVPYQLALVEDFLAALSADGPRPVPADHRVQIEVQPHFLVPKHRFCRQLLIGLQVGMPAASSARGGCGGAGAQIGQRKDAQRAHLAGVDERGGDLAVIAQAHGPVSHGTAGGNADAVGKAAIHLHHGVRMRLSFCGNVPGNCCAACMPIRTPSTWRGHRCRCSAATWRSRLSSSAEEVSVAIARCSYAKPIYQIALQSSQSVPIREPARPGAVPERFYEGEIHSDPCR